MSGGYVAITLIGFTLLYGVLAVIALWLAVREVRKGTEPERPEADGDAAEPTLAY